MKIRFALSPFFFPLLFAASSAATAPVATSAQKPPPTQELALVVVTPVALSENPGNGGAFTDFDRLDRAFQEMAKRRGWPVKIVAERFAANGPAHDLELRVYLQPVRQDLPQLYAFRGWMTLTERGTKHDFGLVVYRQEPRPFERMDDFLEKIMLGAANVAATKIEPILFPQLVQPKP